MSRNQRQSAILVLCLSSLIACPTAANADSKGFRQQQSLKVVSVTQDLAGNFVLLNFPRGQQVCAPSIRYLPGPDGQAVMAADFVGLALSQPASLFRFSGGAIKQLHIGQLSSSPPVVRATFIAPSAAAFKRIEFRSSPGNLVIKVPGDSPPRQTYAQPQAVPAPAPPFSVTTAPQTAPPIAAPAIDPNKPVLRGPIVTDQVSDAQYIRLPEPEPPQPAPDRTKGKPAAQPERAATPAAALQPAAAAAAEEMPPVAPGGLKRLWKRFVGTAAEKKEGLPTPEPVKTPLLKPVQITLSNGEPPTVQVQMPESSHLNTFRLHNPERYVIDIEGADSGQTVLPAVAADNRYIKGLRVGSPEGAPTTARIVVDLAAPDVGVAIKSGAGKGELALIFGQQAQPEPAKTAGKNIAGCLVVLDAGHGGTDPGAQRGDVQEKELTMQIVEKLRATLVSKGIRVRLTRADDTFVSLEDRVRITNECAPDAFVSVHINSLETNATTTGIETYYQNEASKDLAQLIHTCLVKELAAPDRNVRKARFYVINHTPVPAILAEVGFISNKEERDKLTTAEYQEHIAEALEQGVMLYLSERPLIGVQTPEPVPRAREVGTISALPPSAPARSFTQNLQSKKAALPPIRQPEKHSARVIAAKAGGGKRKTQTPRQILKFKKSGLAYTRS